MGKKTSSSVKTSKKQTRSKKTAKVSTKKSTKASKIKSKTSPKPQTKKVLSKKQVKQSKTKTITKKATPKTKIPKAPKTADPGTNQTGKPKVASGPKGYTGDEYEKYKQEKKRLASFNNNDLKAMLKKNLQSMSGNKDQLIEKIADGIVLGRIPRCPNCFGGRPKYNSKNGTYHCSGYRDDEDFKNCHSNFTKQQLKRDPWQA